MHIDRMQLKNIRTFEEVNLNLSKGIHLITGDNASGKTNFLETMHYIATTKSIQNRNDKNIISWQVMQNSILPIGKISAQIKTKKTNHEIDMMFSKPIKESIANENPTKDRLTKNFRINGITKKASEVIGTLRAIYASPNDMQFILGTPADRRKYLDILISQYNNNYLKSLQKCNRILRQRNGLHKQIRSIKKRYNELDYWDNELATTAIEINFERMTNINRLEQHAQHHYEILDKKGDLLSIKYRPSLSTDLIEQASKKISKDAFIAGIKKNRDIDLRQSTTTFGPHRDDISVHLNELPANAFGSRGQQKLITISLRLAEAYISNEVTGEQPVLLMDDILSEFDQKHREYIVEHASYAEQVFLTSPDLSNVPSSFIDKSMLFTINNGQLKKN